MLKPWTVVAVADTPEKVAYLARKVRDQQEELAATEQALQEAIDEWAAALSDVRVGDRVEVVGTPTWPAQVVGVRAALFRDPPEETPVVVVEVKYVRKDGQLGVRRAQFYDGQDAWMKWKLRAVPRPKV